MAKYCRYCKEIMKNPGDKFCYKCHKEGDPVGFFYRFATPVDISEFEKDVIRETGGNLLLSSLIMSVLPISFFVLIICVLCNEPVSVVMICIFVLTIASFLAFVWVGFTGFRLTLLSQKAVNKKWKIALIVHAASEPMNRRGATLTSSKLNGIPKAVRKKVLEKTLIHLAEAEKSAPPEKIEPNLIVRTPGENWKCSFCGYVNPSERIDCKSCGKTR